MIGIPNSFPILGLPAWIKMPTEFCTFLLLLLRLVTPLSLPVSLPAALLFDPNVIPGRRYVTTFATNWWRLRLFSALGLYAIPMP
jgi:hypothetical protein